MHHQMNDMQQTSMNAKGRGVEGKFHVHLEGQRDTHRST